MRTLSKLVYKEIITLFFFNFAAITALTTLIFVRRFIREEVNLSDLFEVLPAILINTFPFSIPLAAIVCCCQLTNRWKWEGQITSLASGGLPLATLNRCVIFFFLIIGAISIPLNHEWIPHIRQQLSVQSNEMLRNVFIAKIQSGLPIVLSTDERLFTSGLEGAWMHDLVYTRKQNDEIQIISAQSGQFDIDQNNNVLLKCKKVRIDYLQKDIQRAVDLEEHIIPIDSQFKSFRDIENEMTQSTSQLTNVADHLYEKAQRWSFIILIPFLSWLGLKLGLMIPWHSKISAFFFSLLPIGFIYYPLLMFFRSRVLSETWHHHTVYLALAAIFTIGLFLNRFLLKQGLK